MSILETFALALQNIWSSKVRTLLTMMGIIIGVTAVIVIVGLGNGMQNYMAESFASLGTNQLTVIVTGRGSTRSISVDEMYELVEDNSGLLEHISPTVSMMGQIKVGTETLTASATGVGEDYLEMKDLTVTQGRGIQYADISERKSVCVAGAYVAKEYFNGNAVGQTIRVNGRKLTVVGVLEQQEDEMEEGGSDDKLYLPYSTASRFFGGGRINNYTVTVVDENQISTAKTVIENALYEVFGDSDAYTVSNMSEILETMNSMIGMVITVLALIAGISLLVGGIGIMNIMLVSVTERTREIGIRKALGAREGVILRQFVIEAATTSGLGGLLGILLGYLLSQVATVVITSLTETAITVAPTLGAVAMASGISVAIGILFGFLPARKAARLNPIDALRYD